MVYVEDTRPDVVVVDQPAVVAPVAPVAPAGSPHFWDHFTFLGRFIQTLSVILQCTELHS